MKHPKFFIDFDGTIANVDVIDTLLERYADVSWKQIEERWANGEIGSRECLSRQVALIRMKPEELENVIQHIQIDASFPKFLELSAQLQIQVTIVSDGMDQIIRGVLKRFMPDDKIPVIYSNKLSWSNQAMQIGFPEGEMCVHACANCKERVIQRLRKSDDLVIYVGDGLSDRFGAAVSDITFAKKKLLNYCKQNLIPYRPFNHFSEISEWLSNLMSKIQV